MSDDSDDGISYLGAESYSSNPKEKISFRIIVLKAVERIGKNANVEWHGGYWVHKEKPIGNGLSITEKYYVQDTREVYSNSIDYLYDLCYPYFSSDTLKATNAILSEYEKCKDEAIKDKRFSGWRLDCSRKMFRELSIFLKSVQYFKSVALTDEDDGIPDED